MLLMVLLMLLLLLLLQPPDGGGQMVHVCHVFKEKFFRKSRPCNLCHQPIKRAVASSCRG